MPPAQRPLPAAARPAVPADGRCPQCRGQLTAPTGYVVWCPSCDWNLDPSPPEIRDSRTDRLFRRLSATTGQRLFEELSTSRRVDRPRAGLARAAALAIALCVHLVTLAIFAYGVWMLVAVEPNVLSVILGVVFVAVGFFMRPRVGKVPKGALKPADAPRTFEILGRVADEAGARVPRRVVILPAYNAYFGVVGLRRTSVLGIGLPLLAALKPDELSFVLGHELGHGVNGDSRNGLMVGSAVTTLTDWYVGLRPNAADAVSTFGVSALFAPVAWGILGLLHLEIQLLFHSGQRAEYRADLLGVRVSSTAAAGRALEAMLLEPLVMNELRRATLSKDPRDLFAVVRDKVASAPATEWERLRRISVLRGHQVDSTHPPTHLRRALVEALPVASGSGVVTAADVAAMRAELAPQISTAAKELHDQFVYAR